MQRAAVVVLALAACKGNDRREPIPREAGVAARATDARAAPADAGPDPRLGLCDALLPAGLRAQHFADMAVTEEALARDLPAAGCILSTADRAGHIYVLCADEAGYPGLMDYARKQLPGSADLALGRRAFTATVSGATMLQVWDDDAPCLVTINGFAGDAAKLGRAFLDTLTPEIGARIHAIGGGPDPD